MKQQMIEQKTQYAPPSLVHTVENIFHNGNESMVVHIPQLSDIVIYWSTDMVKIVKGTTAPHNKLTSKVAVDGAFILPTEDYYKVPGLELNRDNRIHTITYSDQKHADSSRILQHLIGRQQLVTDYLDEVFSRINTKLYSSPLTIALEYPGKRNAVMMKPLSFDKIGGLHVISDFRRV